MPVSSLGTLRLFEEHNALPQTVPPALPAPASPAHTEHDGRSPCAAGRGCPSQQFSFLRIALAGKQFCLGLLFQCSHCFWQSISRHLHLFLTHQCHRINSSPVPAVFTVLLSLLYFLCSFVCLFVFPLWANGGICVNWLTCPTNTGQCHKHREHLAVTACNWTKAPLANQGTYRKVSEHTTYI